MTNPPRVWDGVLRRLQMDISAFALKAWLQPLTLEINGNAASITCPTAFNRDRVRERFLPLIQRRLAEELGHSVSVTLSVGSAQAPARVTTSCSEIRSEGIPFNKRKASDRTERELAPQLRRVEPPYRSADPKRQETRAASSVARVRSSATQAPKQLAFPATFDAFIVGPCNALAREASYAVALDRQQCANPLYLTSEAGLGKTHLARAIVEEARRVGRQNVTYASAESFTNHFMASIRAKQMDRFKRRYRYNDLLIIEDVQFLSGKKATQLELFHTITHLLDTGGRVVLTGDRLPHSIERFDSRLCSQMSAGLVAELEAPNAIVRRQILLSAAANGGVRLPEECLDLLVDVVRGSLRDLTGVLVQLVASASLLKRPIDLDLTEIALRKVAPERRQAKRLKTTQVIDTVAAFFGTSPVDLASRSRKHEVLHPRQIAMYLCTRFTDATIATIAGHFNRDHPAVNNSIKAVERRMLERAKLRYQIEELVGRLESLVKEVR